MTQTHESLIRRWFQEVWNEGNEQAIDEMFAPHAVAFGIGESDADVHGPEEFKPFVRNLRGAMPDLHIRVEDILGEGDKAAVRVVLTGTHTGSGLGVAPSGNRVRVAGIVLVHLRDGQIVEGWNSWDQLGLLRQIGALPRPDAGDQFLAARS